MNIVLCDSAAKAVRHAAELLRAQVARSPKSVMGWATGGTMSRLYQELVTLQQQHPLDWSGVRSFHLDEYIGLAADHPQSYRHFLRHQLMAPLGLQEARAHWLRGDAPDLEQEGRAYESALAQAGGIDLQLLGIGHNGHIGFNEPGARPDTRTRVIRLSASTLAANQRFFVPGVFQPQWAITLGIQTILESRQIVLLALGEDKAHAVAAMVEGSPSDRCPASALQAHPATTVVLDAAAAALLKRKGASLGAPPA